MAHAFPEDELRPLSCQPQTRNRDNPADIGLNDVLGNYSLTLIDSLSTLAILASGEVTSVSKRKRDPLRDFQNGVKDLVGLYGEGTEAGPCGTRACGFDLDSKVQVFETNIRGVGGLLSAHLFAMGDLPIHGYNPTFQRSKRGGEYVQWKNGFQYSGQLLNLAYDLASRLLPAFNTTTGIPYPRVNLRHGAPFYQASLDGICRLDGSSSDVREITENCAAGAGSLVLEFSTLSRLTGDMRFENFAKQAFWAIWNRRSSLNLVGNGIDAEDGQWTSPPLAGVGAGVDSFFEYSMKSYILLSNLPYDHGQAEAHIPENFLHVWQQAHAAVKHHIYRDGALEKHPFYSQVDLASGAPRYTWVDNLSAYYPGLLVLAGEVEEAIESHLLYTALWTRYGALPERWHATNGWIDPHFRHWVGRPEFIESTFHLYQATRDPYYLHVGEMALSDIRRRCWTSCGWADLADVETGEQRDRMESFFLGETAKYFYLLFSEDHPLNKLDQPVVFTTEGHPLLVPRSASRAIPKTPAFSPPQSHGRSSQRVAQTCAAPPSPLPLTKSHVANRPDLFHAAAMAQLHLVTVDATRPSHVEPPSANGPGISLSDISSPTNYTFYPWTLPASLVPANGRSSSIRTAILSTLTFPNIQTVSNGQNDPVARLLESGGMVPPQGAIQKLTDGLLITSLSNLRLNLVQEVKSYLLPAGDSVDVNEYRIQGIANWGLGKDERVLITTDALSNLGSDINDEHFRRVKDLEKVDLIVDIPIKKRRHGDTNSEWMSTEEVLVNARQPIVATSTFDVLWDELNSVLGGLLASISGSMSRVGTVDVSSTATPPEHTSGVVGNPSGTSLEASLSATPTSKPASATSTSGHRPFLQRRFVPAFLPSGPGAAPLPLALDNFNLAAASSRGNGYLPLTKIFFLHSTLCKHVLPASIVMNYSVLIVKRGGCSFSEKLANIPAFVPRSNSGKVDNPDTRGLQVVLVLNDSDTISDDHDESNEHDDDDDDDDEMHHLLIRPFLDQPQRTPNGFERRYGIAMLLVDGGFRGSVVRPAPPDNAHQYLRDEHVEEEEEEPLFSNAEALRRLALREGKFDTEGKVVEWDGEFNIIEANDHNIPRKGAAIRRRYWFESLGMVISNLGMF
jgi:hypothetical protein